MEIKVMSLDGKESGAVTLSDAIFGLEPRADILQRCVVWQLAKRRAGSVVVIRVNVEREPELARRFGIQGVPTFVIVRKGAERDRTSGAMSEDNFALWVASRT